MLTCAVTIPVMYNVCKGARHPDKDANWTNWLYHGNSPLPPPPTPPPVVQNCTGWYRKHFQVPSAAEWEAYVRLHVCDAVHYCSQTRETLHSNLLLLLHNYLCG